MRVSSPANASLSAASAVASILQTCRFAAASTSFGGAALLAHRMAALKLTPADLAFDATLQFSDLQRRCGRCASKARCEADLANEFADPGWDAWRNYCPNATILAVSNALRGCRQTAGRSESTDA